MLQVISARSFQIPQLHLEVRRALPREWVHFRDHHYKDHLLEHDGRYDNRIGRTAKMNG